MFALGGSDEVKGTGVWNSFELKRKEDGEVQFGKEEESPGDEKKK